jgi:hypothetical protein
MTPRELVDGYELSSGMYLFQIGAIVSTGEDPPLAAIAPTPTKRPKVSKPKGAIGRSSTNNRFILTIRCRSCQHVQKDLINIVMVFIESTFLNQVARARLINLAMVFIENASLNRVVGSLRLLDRRPLHNLQ